MFRVQTSVNTYIIIPILIQQRENLEYINLEYKHFSLICQWHEHTGIHNIPILPAI